MYRARQAFSMLDPSGIRPTAIVLGIIAALFFGAQIVNALIPIPGVAPQPGTGPGSGPFEPGQPGPTLPPIVLPTAPTGPGTGPLPPVSVLNAGPLRIPLVAGWQPVSSSSSNAAASLVKGAVQIDLFSLTISGGTGTPTAVYSGYMGIIGENATGFSAAQPAGIQIDGGLPAARGAYTGVFGQSQIEGEVTAFVTGTTDGWVWDAWGPAGTLGSVLAEGQRMIDNMQLVEE
jgi:hypothetical protein